MRIFDAMLLMGRFGEWSELEISDTKKHYTVCLSSVHFYTTQPLAKKFWEVVEYTSAKTEAKPAKPVSKLSYIQCTSDNPLDLFKEWWDTAHHADIVMPSKACLSTASLSGNVTSRYILVQDYDDEGFVFITDQRSRKYKDIKDHPQAAMVFMWAFVQNGNQYLRQVRIEGELTELNKDCVQNIYDDQLSFCKIRAHLCHQDQEVDWDELNARHDELTSKVEQVERLPMPEHVVGFKLRPCMMEFYYSITKSIADRLYFENNGGVWTKKRLAA